MTLVLGNVVLKHSGMFSSIKFLVGHIGKSCSCWLRKVIHVMLMREIWLAKRSSLCATSSISKPQRYLTSTINNSCSDDKDLGFPRFLCVSKVTSVVVEP